MDGITNYLKELMNRRFYGTVEISFHHGKPYHISQTESILVEKKSGKVHAKEEKPNENP